MIFPKHWTFYALLTLLLDTTVSGQDCLIKRDVDTCKAKDWTGEYQYLMAQNSLRTIMDCVEISRPAGSTLEWTLCRPDDDGIPNNKDDERFEFQMDSQAGEWCTKPRTILINGPLTYPNGKVLSIRGALRACPKNDPDFHHCLCMQNVQVSAMLALAQFFKPATQDFKCNKLAQRATSFLDDMVESTPHMHAAQEKHSVNARAVYNFVIDDYGQPVYQDGTAGYRLPFYDQYILAGKYARRCYVHPEANEVASCRTWLLPTPVASPLSLLPLKASYAKAFTSTASITLTAAPSIASIPTKQLFVSGPSVTGANATPSSPTARGSSGPSPAAGTSNGGSITRTVSISQIMVVAVFYTLFFS